MEVNFRGIADIEECEGTFKLSDLNETDMDFEIDSISLTFAGVIGSKARSILKKCLNDEIISLFKNMREDLMNYESDPKKIEKDKKEREDAKKLTAEIYKEKGAEKDRMLLEQKMKETELKMKKMQI